jgi:hypothetical protein
MIRVTNPEKNNQAIEMGTGNKGMTTFGEQTSCYFYENPAEYPEIYGGDECGAGVRGMQSPSLPSIMPRFLKRGSLLFVIFEFFIVNAL